MQTIGLLFVILFGYSSALSSDYYHFAFFRFLTTIGVGIMLTSLSTLLSESMVPIKENIYIIFNYFFLLGAILVSVFSYFLFESMNKGNWREMIAISNLVSIVFLVLTLF